MAWDIKVLPNPFQPGFYYTQTNWVENKPLPVVNVDEKGLMSYNAKEFLGDYGNIAYGQTASDGQYYTSFLDYTQKNYRSTDDPLGVNNWAAKWSKQTGGGPLVEYKPIQSMDLNFLPTNGAIIFEGGKIKSIVGGNPEGLTVIMPEAPPEHILNGLSQLEAEPVFISPTQGITPLSSRLPLKRLPVRLFIRLMSGLSRVVFGLVRKIDWP